MFNFRQKIILSYFVVFILFILVMFPAVSSWVHRIVFQAMEARASQIISRIKDAKDNDDLIRRLKDQKSLMFFRSSIITDEQKLLYDSYLKRMLGPKFNKNYIVDHPEVHQAFEEGIGYCEKYSKFLGQDYCYFAKAFDFHGRPYVLRIAFPRDYLKQLSNDFEIGFLASSSIILLLFSLMTWFVIHRLTKPIQQIIDIVKPYQESNQYIIPQIEIDKLKSNDEFGKLLFTLNSLSSRIKNHIEMITKERNEKEVILESLVEGVIAVDITMQITYTNHTALKLLNYMDSKNVIGLPFTIFDQEKCEKLLHRCQELNKPKIETIELMQEGKKIYLELIAAPLKDNAGAVLVLHDKTSHYKIFEMRRDFIANASHELKTPITVIRGFAEALYDNPGLPQATQEEITSKIMRHCQRMTALIKDLLTLADIENIPTSRLNICDLVTLSEHCQSLLFEVFPDAMVTIEKNKEEIILVADVDLLELALMNLIENAAKYSHPPARIKIKLEDKDSEVILQIIDHGIGIPPADRDHIFDRFYTVDKAHSQKMGGSGLGLSIVKTIVEKHFGTIFVSSEVGVGTIFTILLPKRNLEATG